MRKVSKSDQPINHDEHAQAAQRAADAPRSTHFEVGTFVHRRYQRGEILARPRNGCILVRWENGDPEILYPQALAFESKVR